MEIPNNERAVVDIKKLQEYCLNDNHPRGKHKARVFRSALGLTQEDSAWLKEKLLEAVRTNDAEEDRSDRFGQRYVLDFELETKMSKETIRSKWIVRDEESFPRFVTCFVI